MCLLWHSEVPTVYLQLIQLSGLQTAKPPPPNVTVLMLDSAPVK